MGEVRLSAHFLWKVSDLRIITLETVEEMPLAGERLELPTLRFSNHLYLNVYKPDHTDSLPGDNWSV